MSAALLQPVTSSNLQAVGYDRDSGTLFVQFRRSGAIWEYRRVPPETHQAMVSAGSVGKYFIRHVREHFEAAELGDEAALGARMRELAAFRRDLEDRDREAEAQRRAVDESFRALIGRDGRAIVTF